MSPKSISLIEENGRQLTINSKWAANPHEQPPFEANIDQLEFNFQNWQSIAGTDVISSRQIRHDNYMLALFRHVIDLFNIRSDAGVLLALEVDEIENFEDTFSLLRQYPIKTLEVDKFELGSSVSAIQWKNLKGMVGDVECLKLMKPIETPEDGNYDFLHCKTLSISSGTWLKREHLLNMDCQSVCIESTPKITTEDIVTFVNAWKNGTVARNLKVFMIRFIELDLSQIFEQPRFARLIYLTSFPYRDYFNHTSQQEEHAARMDESLACLRGEYVRRIDDVEAKIVVGADQFFLIVD
ncbi:unnamed protein product [Caenorhabditis sp. 36 PRJEB53466]|nr:unnamed protein product [Caenorhabditis sp. 36 PRJEB53466]